MHTNLKPFQNALSALDLKPFGQAGLELKAGIWVNSACLKIQKSTWRNNGPADIPFQNSIFFSIWIGNDPTKLLYNIHALKLRELKAYKLKSRDFAEAFRVRFKPFEKDWPNVSTSFGPLTLMEGWEEMSDLETQIQTLAIRFLSIYAIIDDLLAGAKK